MQQTSDKGDSSEIQHKIMLKHNIKASNRAFDLLVNTN